MVATMMATANREFMDIRNNSRVIPSSNRAILSNSILNKFTRSNNNVRVTRNSNHSNNSLHRLLLGGSRGR